MCYDELSSRLSRNRFRICATALSFLTSSSTTQTTMSAQTSNFTLQQQQHILVPPPAQIPAPTPNPNDTNEEWSEEQLLANLRKLDELHRKVQLP